MNQCIERIDSNGWNEWFNDSLKRKSLFATYWNIDVTSNTQTDSLSGAKKQAD